MNDRNAPEQAGGVPLEPLIGEPLQEMKKEEQTLPHAPVDLLRKCAAPCVQAEENDSSSLPAQGNTR